MGGSHFRSSVIAIASVLAVVLGVFGAAPQQSAGTVERASAKGVKTRAFIRAVLRATTSESVLRIRTNGTRVKVRHKAGATTRTRTLKPRRGRVVHRLPVGTEKVRVRATGGRGHRPSKWRSVRVRPTPPRKPVDLVGPPEQVVGSAHVPIGVWLESVTSPRDISLDKAAGINTYVGLTTSSDLGLATDAGMSVILQQNEWLTRRPADHDGWVLADEIDMQHSPGTAFATLSDILKRLPADGLTRYSNYGKGVAFWNSDTDAARFVNEFQDITSADTYWFTDGFICGISEGGRMFAGGTRSLTDDECHRAANYGATVQRLRALDARDGRLQPIWSYVEVGHPFSEDHFPSIKPTQIRAAVWHSIIGGAQGIVYFNHSFGGPCPTQHALREPCYADQRAAVSSVNRQIAQLATVINGPTDTASVKVSEVRALVKRRDDAWYIFAGSDGTTGARTFTVAGAPDTTVEVLGEDRSLTLTGGRFQDTFPSENTIHIYRVPAV